MRMTAIVPSAGSSQRMKAFFDKPYLLLGDKPIMAHALLSLERSPLVQEIILLVRSSRLELARKLVRVFRLRKVRGIYAGGATRFESVGRGLEKVSPETDFVLVHDGARPLLQEALLRRVVRAAMRYGAAIPVLPVAPTLKRGKGAFVGETLVRKGLWEVQTPQVFQRELLVRGYLKAKKEKQEMTDCASVVERLGKKVRLVPGDPRNIKITTKEELALSRILLKGDPITPCAWG